MIEFVTEAIVIKTNNIGELNREVDLLAPRHGRFTARTISGAKTNSRLSPHLQAASIVHVRITEKKTRTITDALEFAGPTNPRSLARALDICHFLDRTIPYELIDSALYHECKAVLIDETKSLKLLLSSLGYNPLNALCPRCKSNNGDYFNVRTHTLVCKTCALETKSLEHSIFI